MKGHKGEVVKLSQVKGGSASGEREPLFPRLHVNETEKAGPKAPPRNKMALYEQFTVPSHRFLQPTQASPATAFQQPYGSGYPYIPYYIPSVQYTTNNSTVQAYSRPSQVTSCSGITSGSVVVNQESRKAPRLHKVGSLSPCKVSRGLTEASADCIMSDVAEQRGNGAKNICGSLALNDIGGNIPAGKERRHISDRTERVHEAASTLEQGKEGIHKRSDSSRVDDMADNERRKCLSGDVSILGHLTETLTKETNQGALAKSLRKRSESKHNCVSQAVAALGQCVMQSVTSFEPRNSEESGTVLVVDDQSLLSMDGECHGSALTFDESLRNQSVFNSLQSSVLDTKEEGISKLAVLGKPEVGSSEKLNAIQDKEHEVSQSACREGHPDIAADSAPEIKPRDVILAIGQQQFWKARKTLLRQQRIFSDQVFQLHKLIMIQHLLAETSGTLIDDAVHFETVGQCDAAAKKTFNTDDFACKGSDSKKRSKSQSVSTEVPPAVSRDDKKEVNTSVLELTHGGVNAWGYPSFGHWIGPGAPQGQPFSYQPLAGSLPPGSAFGLPYGSAVPGLAAPMVSFGIPYCGQRREFSAEMGSNYGPATISKCDGSGFVSRNFGHFSNDLAASWYLMQQNSLNNQMLQSGKDAPTGSGASVNKVPGTAVQHVKTTCFPGLTYQLGLNSQSVTEGLESSAQQSDISSPSIATRLDCSVTPLKPSVQAAKKPGLTTHKEAQGVAQNFDGGIAYPSHSSNSRRSLDKNYVDARQCSMDQKEGGSTPLDEDELVDASVHSSDLGNGALELFPLVPSLSSRGQNGERDLRSVDCVQGLVIRAVPRRAVAASESTAGILLSLQQERQK